MSERKEAQMLKHFREKEPPPTELTWEEKNPTDYVYRPSEAMQRWQEKAEAEEGRKSHKSQQK